MRKVLTIVFVVIIILLCAYSVISTMAMIERTQEYDELYSKYNELTDSYKSLSEKNTDSILKEIETTPVVIDAIAKNIDNNATTSVMKK